MEDSSQSHVTFPYSKVRLLRYSLYDKFYVFTQTRYCVKNRILGNKDVDRECKGDQALNSWPPTSSPSPMLSIPCKEKCGRRISKNRCNACKDGKNRSWGEFRLTVYRSGSLWGHAAHQLREQQTKGSNPPEWRTGECKRQWPNATQSFADTACCQIKMRLCKKENSSSVVISGYVKRYLRAELNDR